MDETTRTSLIDFLTYIVAAGGSGMLASDLFDRIRRALPAELDRLQKIVDALFRTVLGARVTVFGLSVGITQLIVLAIDLLKGVPTDLLADNQKAALGAFLVSQLIHAYKTRELKSE